MTTRLFVGNLSFDISEKDLQAAFTRFGAGDVQIPRWDSGKPKGFGFVEVEAERAGEAINKMSGRVLGDRPIDVAEARPRPELPVWGSRAARPHGFRRFRR